MRALRAIRRRRGAAISSKRRVVVRPTSASRVDQENAITAFENFGSFIYVDVGRIVVWHVAEFFPGEIWTRKHHAIALNGPRILELSDVYILNSIFVAGPSGPD